MAVQNLEVKTKSILSAVVRLPENEVDKLFKDSKRLKKCEEKLVEKVTTTDLSPEEHNKLIYFNDKLENIGVKRLEWLYEISQIR